MGARRRCCCKTCVIGEDDFSVDLNKWYIINGTPSLESGQLRLDESEYVVFKTPAGVDSGVVHVQLCGIADGTTFKIVLGCDINGTGGHTVTFRFYDVSGYLWCQETITGESLETETDSFATSWETGSEVPCQQVSICYSGEGGQLAATELGGGYGKTRCVERSHNNYVGLASDAGTVYYDAFEYVRHHIELDGCPSCDCSCDGFCLMEDLVATLVFTDPDACPELNGASITLSERYPIGPKGVEWNWYGQWTCGPPGSTSIELEFECGQSSATKTFQLRPSTEAFQETSGGTDYPVTNILADTTCKPISIKFGPFHMQVTTSDIPGYGQVAYCCDDLIPDGQPGPELYIYVTNP